MRSGQLHDALGKLTKAIREVAFLAVSLAEIEGCIARRTPLKLLTVNHAMRTLVYLLRNEAEETAAQQRQ